MNSVKTNDRRQIQYNRVLGQKFVTAQEENHCLCNLKSRVHKGSLCCELRRKIIYLYTHYKERDHLEDLSLGGSVKYNWILYKWDANACLD